MPVVDDPQQLCPPKPLAGVHIESEDGVAGAVVVTVLVLEELGDVTVARGRIELAVFEVEGRGVPHRRSGRPPELRAGGVRAKRLRRFGERVGRPDFLARVYVNGDDAALELAASVLERHAGHLLPGGHSDIQMAARRRIECRRTGHLRGGMVVGPHRPQLLAGLGVDCADVAHVIAEHCRVAHARHLGHLADADRGAHLTRCLERPVHTARLSIERIDEIVVATDEQCSVNDGRLRPCSRRGARERECPFELQVRGLGAGEAGGGLRLEPVRPRRVRSPTVPRWLRKGIVQTQRAGARVAHGVGRPIGDAAERLAARQLCHRA